MNLSRLPKCYQFVIGILTIISQITNSIGVDDYSDSISLANPTNYYDHALHILGRHRRQNTNTDQSCEIPSYPLNSIYKIVAEPEAMYKPGDRVKNYSTLRITCEKGYKQPPFALHTSLCLNGQWEDLPPACVRTCPSLKSTQSMSVKCIYNDTIPLRNCMYPVEGTSVRLSCNTFYEADSAIKRNSLRACKEGEWNPSLPECVPTCGLKTPKAQLNIINGRNVTRGDFPWHTGIYSSTMEYRCGGSIIHNNIILSAAHCFANYSGNKYPAKDYLVAAGKYFNQYYDDREQYAQYSSVRDIFIPEQYKSIDGFNSYDIAVVTMEDPFTYTLGVQPVCIELNNEYENPNYLMNNNGIVTGWGYTDDRQVLSPVLKELIIPSVSYDTCYNQVPSNFRRFLTSDKICGGFLNQSTSVCQGDSGGGLVYNINNHYYIKGIVSTSPASANSGVTNCDPEQYGLYTSVKYHTDFIAKHIANYGWKENIQCVRDDCTNEDIENRDSCRLPNFPQHGKYRFPNNIEYKSGNNARIHDVVLLSCDSGYVANPPELYCLGKGQWIPTVGTCEASQTTDGQLTNNQDGQQQNVQNQNESANFLLSDFTKSSKFNYFDLDMLKILDKNENYFENYLISPISIKIALFMLLESTRGNSGQEIIETLQTPKGIVLYNIRQNLYILMKNILIKIGTTVLNSANLVTISNNYTVLELYRETLQEEYKAQIIPVDYINSVSSATLINNWVKTTTKNSISEIISAENFNDETSLVIANALFFKAQWKTQFEKNIQLEYFRTFSDDYLVQTMKVNGQFRYRYIEQFKARAVELPYSDGECAMLILLPYASSIPDVLTDLQHSMFARIIDSLEQTEILVSLPIFDIEYSTDLRPTLERMGIKEIFSENTNLRGIVEPTKNNVNVRVSKFLHKAKVEVNEKGTTTAAVMGSSSESFIVDHAFLFFIYNVHTKIILFEGRYNKPPSKPVARI